MNKTEDEWITQNCRRHGDQPFPFNPTFYENWFPIANENGPEPKKNNDLWESVMNEEENKEQHLHCKLRISSGQHKIQTYKNLYASKQKQE